MHKFGLGFGSAARHDAGNNLRRATALPSLSLGVVVVTRFDLPQRALYRNGSVGEEASVRQNGPGRTGTTAIDATVDGNL